MATLVTGGSGFVGVHVIRQLRVKGERVVSLSTKGEPEDEALQFLGAYGKHVTWVRGDVTSLSQMRQIIRKSGINAIVHAAAVTALGNQEPAWAYRAVRVNVGGTATVIEAARLEGVSRLVYVSSATVYGLGDPETPIPEEAAPRPAGIYAISKAAAESLFLRCLELYGIEGVVVRISVPYGPLERPTGSRELMSPMWEWCHRAKGRETIVLGEDLQRDFTYAADTARGIVLACLASNLPNRIYNVAGGRNYAFSEVLQVLARIVPGLKIEHRPEPADGFFRATQRGPLDISRARRDLDYAPSYDLERGLRAYMAWLKKFPN